MSDVRPTFPTLEGASGEGLVLRQVVVGDSPVGKNGSLAFAFRDSSGNVVLPQLTASGALPVDTEGASTVNLNADGTNAGTGTETTIATITLQTAKVYQFLEWAVSCFRDTVFNIYWNNNGSLTRIGNGRCGAGQYSDVGQLTSKFTSGGTGTQQILLKASNLNVTSTIDAQVGIAEVQ